MLCTLKDGDDDDNCVIPLYVTMNSDPFVLWYFEITITMRLLVQNMLYINHYLH